MQSVQYNVSLKTRTGVNLIPMDRLIIHKDYLELNASLTGNFVFKPGDITAIKPTETVFSMFGFNAFRIFHKVKGYPEETGFLTLQKSTVILSALDKSGLLNKESDYESPYAGQIEEKQKAGAYPLKKYVLHVAGLILLLLIGFDIYRFSTQDDVINLPGPGFFSAFVLLFLCCLLTLTFRPFRHWIVKKGRTYRDVDRQLYLFLFVALFILLHNLFIGGFSFLF